VAHALPLTHCPEALGAARGALKDSGPSHAHSSSDAPSLRSLAPQEDGSEIGSTVRSMALNASGMPGERFSRLYLRCADPVPDSARARYRIGALFRERVFNEHAEPLASYVGREVGIPQFAEGRYSSQWNQFIRECRIADLLDIVTAIYRYLFWHAGEEIAHWWRDTVRKIFSEEKLAYRIDDVGGVHPAIDQEFQRNLVSTIAALQSSRHQKIGQLIENAAANLAADSPNYKQAWRAIVLAVEGLFALMFPYVRMTADEIERHLLPVLQNAYQGDAAAETAARAMLKSFQSWVESANAYRHHPGAADIRQPPADIGVLAISAGASFVRWLAALDEQRSV
jgi:hypothetical protein